MDISHGGELEESLREGLGVSGEEVVSLSRMLDDDDGKVGAGEIKVEGDLQQLGMYPWRHFLCLRSEAGSQVWNLQSSESTQINDLSPVLANRIH